MILNEANVNAAILSFVIGECVLWNLYAQQFDVQQLNNKTSNFWQFIERTDMIARRVRAYGSKVLDGSCSDFECDIGLKVLRIFGQSK